MPSQLDDIQNALIGLGYSQKDATTIVRELPDEISVNDGIRQALKMLSKNL
jgi:holliday junction DNA helicase RuvA